MKKVLSSIVILGVILGLLFLFNLERFLVLTVGIIGGVLLLLFVGSLISGKDRGRAKKFMATGRDLASKGEWAKAASLYKAAIYVAADSTDFRDPLVVELEELYKSQEQEADFTILQKALKKYDKRFDNDNSLEDQIGKSVKLQNNIRNQLNALPGDKIDKSVQA